MDGMRRPIGPIKEGDKVIFLWLPKCAGVSTHESLRHLYGADYQDYNNQYRGLVFDPSKQCVTFYHSHVPSLVKTGFVPQEWSDRAFKFAFVRNPFDRLVSLYHYLLIRKYPHLPEHEFEGFIRVATSGDYPRPAERNLLGFYQANRMVDWLRPKELNGEWQPDFVGRFEDLQKDWKELCGILGIGHEELQPRNPSKHELYWEYYTKTTKKIVEEFYAEDLTAFGYDF